MLQNFLEYVFGKSHFCSLKEILWFIILIFRQPKLSSWTTFFLQVCLNWEGKATPVTQPYYNSYN